MELKTLGIELTDKCNFKCIMCRFKIEAWVKLIYSEE